MHSVVVDHALSGVLAGLAVGIQLAQLPWKVVGVMLAGPLSFYQQQQSALTALFAEKYLPGEYCTVVKYCHQVE